VYFQAEIRVTDNNEFTPRFSVSTYRRENTLENIEIGRSLIRGIELVHLHIIIVYFKKTLCIGMMC
jgi:hypothetical protein